MSKYLYLTENVLVLLVSNLNALVAQLVRAQSLYLWGPWFESRQAHMTKQIWWVPDLFRHVRDGVQRHESGSGNFSVEKYS